MDDTSKKKKYVDMGRGKTQVLFNYLPGKTFDITGGIRIAEVTQIIGEAAKDISNRPKLLRLIKQYTEKWDAETREEFNNFEALSESIITEQPKSLRYDLFPLTFRCIECNRVYHYHSYAELEKANRDLVCLYGDNCKGRKLRQLYQVAVHSCGNLHGLYPIVHCNCGKKDIILDERRSQKSADFRWVCKKCNTEAALDYYCKECDEQDKRMTIVPHRASKCYFPHSIRCVDVPEASSYEQVKASLRSYLNMSDNSQDSDYDSLLRVLTKRFGSAKIAESVLAEAGKKPAGRKSLHIDELCDTPVGEVVFEYVSTIENRNITVYSLEERAEQLKHLNPRKSTIISDNANLFKDIGFSALKLIEDFPVVTAVFAWSRIDAVPVSAVDGRRVHLKSFKRGTDVPGKTPVYVDNGKCEALMFELEPLTVVKWLRDNGIIVDLATEEADNARHWILCNVKHIGVFEEVDRNSVKEKTNWLIQNLVHSMAHVAMKAIAGISGFEIQGLSEYIFPETLSFVIYSNKTDFIIGGMHTLFEEQADLLRNRMLARDISICMHDPLCSQKKSACHACLYLPEISCSKFNKNLNRNVLYGYEDIRGFFEGRII